MKRAELRELRASCKAIKRAQDKGPARYNVFDANRFGDYSRGFSDEAKARFEADLKKANSPKRKIAQAQRNFAPVFGIFGKHK